MREPLRDIERLHDYYRITPAQLLSTIKNDIPELRPMIADLLESVRDNSK